MIQTQQIEQVPEETGARYQEYLTFHLGGEEYGVDILRVQEIRGWEEVTRVPNQPEYVKGVLNLRGAIIPIFDLRLRLGMPFHEYTVETVVIVLRVLSGNRQRSMGLVVDEVSDVLKAPKSDIRNTPDFGANLNTEFIIGLATADEKMIMLLDVDRLLSSTDNKQQDEPEEAA
ncbi:MAG: purine-binding chemotaxis protein CheW [Gammaproteobacteria bacterium]|nr:purine-binding chemotaxis protein CheW [Gammaproteobacteria bacterium]